ncbi:MAG: poly-beta-1,6-N-acetyl-D-glucosamine biosynthesis protein PgaD [Gammaproteobacteria bacterium]|nr:poly-beta-1,6-N-acetyl-D-glucosamine biosynthesis protein PgaD [Gammaproteobacteria bacterium]NNC97431.1 poly-beta-1,6-N-acetyl-D-glucosamine biosynthesis protein PgaD [Gammaproteobacteria bacterium]NNM13904.1 poly-beta-1,6-N-acetyl-D-glucosamine biosynthesis protein PgaD [Gammaproteobacteria bacterium]
MNDFNMILDHPDALKRHHKITSAGITLVFWLMIIYLWQPLISLIAWAFGYKLFYEHMLILGGLDGLLEILFYYMITVLILGGGLILWARINNYRFRGKPRRNGVPPVKPEWVAEYFEIGAAEQAVWSNTKNLTISISEDNRISASISN